MMRWFGVLFLAVLPPAAQDKQPEETVLMFVAKCTAKEGAQGSSHLYYRFSSKAVTIQKGDLLSYDVFLVEDQPEPKGGIDITFADNSTLRDTEVVDEDGVRCHPEIPISDAEGEWYTRRIDLSDLEGKTTKVWDIVSDGNPPGTYAQFIGKIYIKHKDGSKTWIYQGGQPEERKVHICSRYKTHPLFAPVPRSKVTRKTDFKKLIAEEQEKADKEREQQDK
jgi:hypothetical protein